jgi:hypothetical protein
MAPLTQRGERFAGPSRAARLGLFVCLAAALAGVGLTRAQPPGEPTPPLHYSRGPTFLIPFTVDDRRVVRVHLSVSEDRGKTWKKAAWALPTDKNFRYTAAGDGLYGFATQVEMQDGKLYPETIGTPQQQVVVDTVAPVVTLKPAQARQGSVAVEWDIRDDNLDLMSLRLDYRPTGGRDWLPLAPERRAFGSLEWNPGGNGPYEVRLVVADLAKNSTDQRATVGAGGGGVRPPDPGPGHVDQTPVASEKPLWVNKRRFQLNYKLEDVGPSGVPKMEVWRCTPTLEWKKLDTVDAKPPVIINAEGEGKYGFTLIPISGVDLAPKRPERGDAPQVWVEVDETPPRVRVERVEVGRGADSGNITIYWEASDNRKLADKPVTISFSDKPKDGTWTVIATQLPNTRSFVWRYDEKTVPHQFYVKVDAVDMAGNVGSDVLPNAVKVDLHIPKVNITGIDAAPATPNP